MCQRPCVTSSILGSDECHVLDMIHHESRKVGGKRYVLCKAPEGLYGLTWTVWGVAIVWRWHKVCQSWAEIIPRELEYILGLLSCVSGLNHYRAHLSESEVLGSGPRPKGVQVAYLSRQKFCGRDERVKTTLRGIFLENSEKYPRGRLRFRSSEGSDELCSICRGVTPGE